MQPKSTFRKRDFIFKLIPMFLISLALFVNKVNAQCAWSAATNYPVPILDQATVTVGTNLYSFAGVSNGVIVNNSYKFDGTTWTAIAPLPQALEFPAAVTNGTDIFVLGGANTAGTPTTVVYKYNVAANTYTTLASFTTGTWNHSAVFLNGKIYKFCGTGPATASTNALEIYDVAANTWSTGANYPLAISFVSAVAVGNFIYAAGGIQSVGGESLKAYRYDPVGNTWDDAAIADLPATRWGSASDFYNGFFVMAGGYMTNVISNSALIWDPVGNSWSALPTMGAGFDRARFTGAVLSGSFYAIGGRSTAVAGFVGTNNNQKLSCNFTPCSGTPNPGNTLASLNPVGPGTPFTLSIQNAQGPGTTHQWQSSPNGTTWTNIPGGNTANFVTTQVVQTYYRDSVRCTASALFAYSSSLLVTMNPCGWSYSTPVPIPILDAPAVSIGNNIYTFTAVSNNLVVTNSYKFDGTTWTAIAAFPVAAEFPSACTDGTNAYIMGGFTTVPSTALYRYNVATNTYTQLASCTVGTWNQSCVYLNGKIYKFGGSAAVGSSNALEIYDIAGNTWTTGANLPANLSFIAATTAGGYIYSVGGIDAGANVTSAKTFRYDPATNTWNDAAIADLPADRWGASAYLYGPYNNYGAFALAGGYVSNSTIITTSALQWDPATNAWSPLPDMLTNSARFAAATLGGAYYALGGRQTNSFVGSTFNQKLQCNFPACSGTPAPGNTIGPSNVCVGTPFTLSLQNVPSVSGFTFQWQSSTDNVTYSDIVGATAGTYSTVFAGTRWYRCRVTCSGNTGTSTPLQVLDGQGIFTAQPPPSISIGCGGTVTIPFTATGLSLSYSWEYRINSSSPWLTVNNGGKFSGATTNTLTITDVPSTWNGYQFRGLMVGPCTAVDYTTIVTLTVTPLVAVVNPSSATICTGTIQRLSIANQLGAPPVQSQCFASGPISVPVPDFTTAGVSHSIPVSLPAGSLIVGARVIINMTHTWDGDMVFVLRGPNGQILNLDYYLSGTGGAAATTGFVNTTISSTGTAALSTGTNPYTGTFKADAQVAAGAFGQAGPNGFLPTTNIWTPLFGTANGNWTLAMYDGGPADLGVLTSWQICFDYTAPTFAAGIWTSNPATPNTMWINSNATIPYAGTPEDTIWVNPTVNTVYTVVITTPTPCVSGPTNVTVNVTNPVTNLTIPATKSACVGDNATITATANGGPITWQWQVSNNGGVTYTDIAGATSATLTLTNVTQLMNNYRYRVVATASPCGTVTSATFTTLIVNPLPTITLSANPTLVMPGVTTFVTASSTPAGASYAWTLNGVPITGATTSSVFADVDRMGSYMVTVTDVNGCVRTSSPLVISAQDNPRLFIYPNPNNGQFQARIYSNAIYLFDVHTLRIFNSAGAVMLTKTFPISSQYVRMDFDMRGYAAGVYEARVTHNFTGKTTSAKFVIQH